jgi:colanic acid/amylovoran biosynthesis glycosyltransferase
MPFNRSSPLRVLYVLKRFPQLSQTFVVREILGLEALGVIVGVDALGANETGIRHAEVDAVRASVRYLPRRPGRLEPNILRAHARLAVRRPIRWVRCAAREWPRDRRRFLQAGMVADRARRGHFSVIHAHFATAAADVARIASQLSAIPFTVTAHAKDIYSNEHAPHVADRLSDASHVVTVSRFNVDHLRGVIPHVPITLVRNAVALETSTATESGAGPLLCVARLVEKKGIDTLITAIDLLRYRCPELRLEIVGGGELFDSLRSLVNELALNDRVEFLGSLDSAAVSMAYRRASMLVLPCRIGADGDRDGLPTVIVEAMAHALPVVSTDIIGISEVVRHGDTGFLVPPDDADALAVAIEKLWNDRSLAVQLGAQGRRLVAREFGPVRSAATLKLVFQVSSGARA